MTEHLQKVEKCKEHTIKLIKCTNKETHNAITVSEYNLSSLLLYGNTCTMNPLFPSLRIEKFTLLGYNNPLLDNN